MLPESHPCVGVSLRVFETAVTHRQVETQSRGQLDIVHALVRISRGPRVHLAIQDHPIRLPPAANGIVKAGTDVIEGAGVAVVGTVAVASAARAVSSTNC